MTAHAAIAEGLVGDWLADQRERLAIAGLAVGVLLPDGTAMVRAHGYADVDARRPATPSTPFRLCSLSKTFTSTLVLIARDRGLLNLDDPLASLIPELDMPNPGRDPRPVTLRQCLTHTAGLPKDFPFDYWQRTDETLRRFPDLETSIAALAGSTLVNVPGSTFHYSNVGFALLGLAAERALGREYATLVDELILGPLGMDDSFVWAGERPAELTRGYLPGGTRLAAEFDLAGITAAGGVCSSADDLIAYMRLQLSDEPEGRADVLRGASVREARTPAFLLPDWSLGVGLGWILTRRDGRVLVGHPGDLVGAQVEFLVVPEQRLGLFLLSNTFSAGLTKLADSMLSTLAEVAWEPAPSPGAPADAAVLEKATGRYVGENFDYAVVRVDDVLYLYSNLDVRSPARLAHEHDATFLVVDGWAAGERARFGDERDGVYGSIALQSQLLHRVEDVPRTAP